MPELSLKCSSYTRSDIRWWKCCFLPSSASQFGQSKAKWKVNYNYAMFPTISMQSNQCILYSRLPDAILQDWWACIWVNSDLIQETEPKHWVDALCSTVVSISAGQGTDHQSKQLFSQQQVCCWQYESSTDWPSSPVMSQTILDITYKGGRTMGAKGALAPLKFAKGPPPPPLCYGPVTQIAY